MGVGVRAIDDRTTGRPVDYTGLFKPSEGSDSEHTEHTILPPYGFSLLLTRMIYA